MINQDKNKLIIREENKRRVFNKATGSGKSLFRTTYKLTIVLVEELNIWGAQSNSRPLERIGEVMIGHWMID